jgi:phosphoribosyl-AMP cyclohydrolase
MNVDFNKMDGLVPCNCAGYFDRKNPRVQGYMNEEALERPKKPDGYVLQSKQKNRLWTKVRTSEIT